MLQRNEQNGRSGIVHECRSTGNTNAMLGCQFCDGALFALGVLALQKNNKGQADAATLKYVVLHTSNWDGRYL